MNTLFRSIAFACLTAIAGAQEQAETVRCVDRPPMDRKCEFYTTRRAPLAPSPFLKLPIGSIAPRGWLRRQLELEADGMVGRLEEISPWCKFEGNAWTSRDGTGHSGWEEVPYWLRGYGDLGYVLKDEKIVKNARRWIDAVLASQGKDGYFGPRANRTSLDGKPDLWPHMLMLNALQSFHEYAGDERVLPFMTRYCRWLHEQPAETFGRGYWPKMRFGDNLETVYWLYDRTGDTFLLDLARKIHDRMARWSEDVVDWHNVNFAQGFREPGVFYLQAKDSRLLDAVERNYRKAMDLYGQFPGGTFVADENARPGFVDPRGGCETCGIVEFMHSFQMLAKISGNPLWADRCEEIAFDSFPPSMTPDLKALHYLTCANQVQLDQGNKSPGVQNPGTMVSYSPLEVYRCCQHNVSIGWPYYAEELWLATPDGGLCASLYAASEVQAKVGDGATVGIAEETDYPFGDTIHLRISAPKPIRFPLYLRIPRWCEKPAIKINGKALALEAKPLSFAVIERTWSAGDTVTLQLPMRLSVRVWEKNQNAVSVDYGPLSFSLKVGEQWRRYGADDKRPEWEVIPRSPWNYGLILDPKNPTGSFSIESKPGPLPDQPFAPDTVPIELRVKAKRIPAWQQDRRGLIGKLQPSPAKSDQPVETITLIPMGAARLRVSMFPSIGEGKDAHDWKAPAPEPTASHCWQSDTVEAINDGLLPKNSSDPDIPRFTWWDRKGSLEWVEMPFEKPTRISWCEVYWFDDIGRGHCRVPASWRVLWWDGATWKPVADATEYGVAKDRFNRVRFKSVQSTKVRLEVQLQEESSGGILEWRIGE